MQATDTPALDLWQHIFGDSRGLLQIFTGKRNADDGLIDEKGRYFRYPEEARRAWAWAKEESDRFREAYFCAHLLTRKRRVKENAAPMLALYADGDGTKVPDHLPQPTAVVRSSPGREQFFWRLDSETPPEIGENLNRRFAYEIGADAS